MASGILYTLKHFARKTIVRLGYYSKPDFLILGAQKSGTTALFAILKQHSKITGAIRKEVHFFNKDSYFPCTNYSTYHSFFPFPNQVPNGNLVFEATPAYIFKSNAAQRIFDYNPNLKLIICLRNPVMRALSGWTMFHYGFKNHSRYGHLYDDRSFPDAIKEELHSLTNNLPYNKPPYIKTGMYYYQIENYFDLFPRNNLLILEHSAISKKHDETIKQVCEFLNIPYEQLPALQKNESVRENKKDYKEEFRILYDFYKPYNEKLYKLLGINYNWERYFDE